MAGAGPRPGAGDRQVFVRTAFTDPALSSASRTGLVNTLDDGLAGGLIPVLHASTGMPRRRLNRG